MIWKHSKAVERLEEDLRSLRIKVDELERASRGQELEFIELYDKVKRQMSRMAKRYAVDNPDIPPDTSVTSPLDGLDPISKKIHERRGTHLRQAEAK